MSSNFIKKEMLPARNVSELRPCMIILISTVYVERDGGHVEPVGAGQAGDQPPPPGTSSFFHNQREER